MVGEGKKTNSICAASMLAVYKCVEEFFSVEYENCYNSVYNLIYELNNCSIATGLILNFCDSWAVTEVTT